jgi:ABC-type spermidine/putrescine transport system permease subunit I
MKGNNMKIVIGLVLLNTGAFCTAAAFLPRASTYIYSNIVEQFINARLDWDIAWAATIGSSLLSTGLVLLLSHPQPGNNERQRGAAG